MGHQPSRRTDRRSTHFESLESRRLLASAVAPLLVGLDNELNFQNVLPATRSLWNPGGYLTSSSSAQPLTIALNYLKQHFSNLGLTATDVASPVVTDQYSDPSDGMTHIYLQQQLNGLPVAGATMTVNLTNDGKILSLAGGFVANASAAAPTFALPKLGNIAALNIAAQQLGLAQVGSVRSLARTQGLGQLTSLSAPTLSLDPIPMQLEYVPTATGVELAWKSILRTPDGEHWYDVAVGNTSGQVAFASDWVDHATYNVIAQPTESPQDGPSSPNRTLLTDPSDPLASPFGWHDTNGVAGAEFTDTRGNNVQAQEDTNADNTGGVRPDGGASLNFNFPLDLTQSPSVYQSAAITNLFYWNNLLHDIHYKYGFTELTGNFQTNNYGRGGSGNDAVIADAQDGSGINNANFATPPDGSPGRMQMYLFNKTTPNRDGDLDSGVMVHEYGHGVSNRLTGGPANANALDATQSGGMGEGWSDFWAMMFTQRPTDVQSGAYPMGTYVAGQTPTGAGIRRKPYSYDMSIDPLTVDAYGTTGTGGGVTRSTEVHNTGEIWASTLWDMNWLLINKYGFESNIANGYNPAAPKGNTLALQLVMNALKLQPANPSFKDARDAILQADQNLNGGQDALLIWNAFARRGMGFSFVDASSSATTVTPAFDLPMIDPYITNTSPAPVAVAPISSITFQFDEAMNTSSFDVSTDVVTFVGPGNTNLKPTISGFQWVSSTQLKINFATLNTQGSYAMTLGPNILSADNAHPMDQNLNGAAGETADQFTYNFSYSTTLGPDGTGYRAASFPLENIDLQIGQPGVVTLLNNVDNTAGSIDIGANTFNFYGTSYSGTQIGANPNGLITFGTISTSATNTDLTSSPTTPAIAALWDDWRTNATAAGATDSAVLYALQDSDNNGSTDRLVIEWSDVVDTNVLDGAITFQAILQLNTGGNLGRIILNYPDIVLSNAAFSLGGSATVGIKANGTAGVNRLLISQNSSTHPWVQDQSAIVIGTDVDPPTVVNASFVNETAQQVVVTFSEDMKPPTSAALVLGLTNLTTSSTIDLSASTVNYVGATRTLTLTIPGLLPDGNYVGTLLSNGLRDAAGNPLDGNNDLIIGGDSSVSFFVFAGDANHDRVVDVDDLYVLATNWLQSPRTYSQGDFDHNGIVDSHDLGLLSNNWQMRLAAPSSLSSLEASPAVATAVNPPPAAAPAAPTSSAVRRRAYRPSSALLDESTQVI